MISSSPESESEEMPQSRSVTSSSLLAGAGRSWRYLAITLATSNVWTQGLPIFDLERVYIPKFHRHSQVHAIYLPNCPKRSQKIRPSLQRDQRSVETLEGEWSGMGLGNFRASDCYLEAWKQVSDFPTGSKVAFKPIRPVYLPVARKSFPPA